MFANTVAMKAIAFSLLPLISSVTASYDPVWVNGKQCLPTAYVTITHTVYDDMAYAEPTRSAKPYGGDVGAKPGNWDYDNDNDGWYGDVNGHKPGQNYGSQYNNDPSVWYDSHGDDNKSGDKHGANAVPWVGGHGYSGDHDDDHTYDGDSDNGHYGHDDGHVQGGKDDSQHSGEDSYGDHHDDQGSWYDDDDEWECDEDEDDHDHDHGNSDHTFTASARWPSVSGKANDHSRGPSASATHHNVESNKHEQPSASSGVHDVSMSAGPALPSGGPSASHVLSQPMASEHSLSVELSRSEASHHAIASSHSAPSAAASVHRTSSMVSLVMSVSQGPNSISASHPAPSSSRSVHHNSDVASSSMSVRQVSSSVSSAPVSIPSVVIPPSCGTLLDGGFEDPNGDAIWNPIVVKGGSITPGVSVYANVQGAPGGHASFTSLYNPADSVTIGQAITDLTAGVPYVITFLYANGIGMFATVFVDDVQIAMTPGTNTDGFDPFTSIPFIPTSDTADLRIVITTNDEGNINLDEITLSTVAPGCTPPVFVDFPPLG